MSIGSENGVVRFDASRSLPWLLILFAGSGCSALIYEIVWFQLLQLAIGSTSVSLGVLLATFMGGLCIGSLALPRVRALKHEHPLRVYAALEFGIALCGILVLFALPFINRVYVAGAEHGLPGMLLRGLIAADLPAAADDSDGRIAAGHRARHRVHAARRFLVELAVRRQSRPAPSSARCSPASTCCASTTWPRPLTSPRPSTSPSPPSASHWPGSRRLAKATASAGDIRRSRSPTTAEDPSMHWLDLHRHRAFRRDRAGRAGRLDAADGHAAWLDDLRVSPSSWRYS